MKRTFAFSGKKNSENASFADLTGKPVPQRGKHSGR